MSFPQGPMRPPDGVQRGSVMDMPLVSGRSADAGSRRHGGREAAGR